MEGEGKNMVFGQIFQVSMNSAGMLAESEV